MGLFGKKRNEYEEASRSLNSDQFASDRLIIEQMTDNDERAAKLIDQMKNGYPLILNFEDLEPLAANKLLAFFAGASYALEGKSVKINDKTFLFARKVDFLDGSLQRFIDNLPRSQVLRTML